jgi:hypothetical protein
MGMKAVKILSSLSMVLLLCFFTWTAADAAIVWDDVVFNYQVLDNSATVYNFNVGIDGTDLLGTTPQKTNNFGGSDPVDSRVDSSLPNDTSGLGLEGTAGAGGQTLSAGARIEAYAAHTTTAGAINDPYAVGDARQTVVAFLNRNFHVTNEQSATLKGMAGGVMNNPDVNSPPFLFSTYSGGGGVTLNEVVDRSGFPLIQQSWSIDLDDLLNNGPQSQQVNLRTEDAGDPVSYTLITQLDLDTLLRNYNFANDTHAGNIPVGSLGDFDNPLWIEATMEETAIPIPGTLILLLSGIPAVIGLRKRLI